jgi:hypothetical protein
MISIPWWLWLLFGYFLGAMTFSKNLRNQLLSVIGNKKKVVNGNNNIKSMGIPDTPNSGGNRVSDTYTVENDRRHGTTITKIHFDD